jgi:UTP-glucose-1-phosphate uridylyltransferase
VKRAVIFSALCLASCSIYQSNFDCPAGKGVGCKSVNEVLTMIVDKEQGEDLFEQDPELAHLLKEQEKKKRKKTFVKPVAEDTNNKLYLQKERSGGPVLIQAKEDK